MKKSLVLLILFFLFHNVALQAQVKSIASLQAEFKAAKEDTTRLAIYTKILDACDINDNLKYGQEAVDFVNPLIDKATDKAEKNKLLRYKAQYLFFISVYYESSKNINHSKALEYDLQALKIKTSIGTVKDISDAYLNIGNNYTNQGNYEEARKYLFTALRLQIKAEDADDIGKTFLRIGNYYNAKGNRLEAFFYFYCGFKIKNDLGVSKGALSNAFSSNDWETIQKDKNTSFSFIAGVIGFLSGFLFALSILHFFLYVYYKSNKSNLYYSLYSLFSSLVLFMELCNFVYPDANSALFNASFPGDLLGSGATLFLVLFLYSVFYPKPLKFIRILLLMLVLFIALSFVKTSLANIVLAIFRVTLVVEIIRVIFKSKKKKKEGAKLFSIWMWVSFLLFIVIFIAIALMATGINVSGNISFSPFWIYFTSLLFCASYLSFSIVMSIYLSRQVAKTNKGLQKQMMENKELSEKMLEQELEKQKLLESQNEQLEIQVVERTKEIIKQKDLIEQQKEIVEIKNQEITHSIEYALRIQTAILPPSRIVKQYLNNSFIYYKPKDIVAGDFYWMETKEFEDEKLEASQHHPIFKSSNHQIVLFAACDCTGHGVPGAMVSVVCHNALNRAVREFGLTKPSEILDKTAEIVIENFSESEDEIKDGMDISLCAFNPKTNVLEWAGAYNPLWIVRKVENSNNYELIETKADKQSIGISEDNHPFTNHHFTLQTGDTIYIFSDGFADQFGGEGEKKVTKKLFKEWLLSIQNLSMTEQETTLHKFIEEFRKEIEQTDDILVMGVRV